MQCNIENKIKYIQGLNQVIPTFHSNIKSVEYHVFKHSDHDWIQEYLVVCYEGGAKSYRNCNGNSFSAIFDELAAILDSGYYAEESRYNEFVRDFVWKRIDLDFI